MFFGQTFLTNIFQRDILRNAIILFSPGNAVDGEVTTVHDGRRCSETLKEKGPWWTVDLLGTYPGLAPISFFSVSFLEEIIDLPGGQINVPSSGKHYSLYFLPATPSSPSQTLEGLFEPTLRPSRALDSPLVLLPELQRKGLCC